MDKLVLKFDINCPGRTLCSTFLSSCRLSSYLLILLVFPLLEKDPTQLLLVFDRVSAFL